MDHDILLQKLKLYGVMERERLLLRSCLTNRQKFGLISVNKSSTRCVQNGLPQGSVLCGLPFHIFINNLHNLGISGKIFSYADGICLFTIISMKLLSKLTWNVMQSLYIWGWINKFIWNAYNIQLIRFKPKSIKYLGINIHSSVVWDNHKQSLRSRSSRSEKNFIKIQNLLHIMLW